MKNRSNIITATILVVLSFIALSPKTRAVSPAPDGGYAGGNTAEGQSALLGLSTGTYNTAVGFLSLLSNTTNNFNTALGAGALLTNAADGNTATGAGALLSNTTGSFNTADGVFTLFSNTTGFDNTAIGDESLLNNTLGISNTAVGGEALFGNIQGSTNTAIGRDALMSNTTGNNNTAVGGLAGQNLTTGDNNIDIGYNVIGIAGESNTIRIGDTDITDTFIRGISGATIASGDPVLVASNGHLGTITSSKRFKQDIEPMDKTSEAVFLLKPVTFRYTKEIDPAGTRQFGLVAEDVEKVDAQLVTRDEDGKVYSVRYDKVNAMLLNEFLKAHRRIEEQQNQIDRLTARLNEQASEIQKVSAQLGLRKPAPRTVADAR